MPAAAKDSTPILAVMFRLFGFLSLVGGLLILMLMLDELTLPSTAALLGGWAVTTAVLLGFAECIELLHRAQS